MARLFTDGAENGMTTFWDMASGVSVVSTPAPAKGNYLYGVNNGGAVKAFTGTNEVYFRARVQSVTAGSTGAVIGLENSASPGVYHLRLSFNFAFNRWDIYNCGTLIGNTGIGSCPNNVWKLLEARLKVNASTGAIEVKLDGVVVFSATGINTLNAYASTVDAVAIEMYYAVMYLDDLALNDNSGGSDIGWCGDGRVLAAMIPNAAGDSTQWTPSAGSNYQCVDEIPANTTDYVSDSTSGHIDNYNLATVDITGYAVGRVWVEAYAMNTTVAETIDLGLKTHGTNYVDNKALPATWGRVVGDDMATNPNTGNPWNQTELDDLQITLKIP